MEFIFTETFKKQLKAILPNKTETFKENVNACIKDFQENRFKSKYYRHPINNGKYRWMNIHELWFWGDRRMIVQLKIVNNICYFLNVWTHSTLELSNNKKIKINPVYK